MENPTETARDMDASSGSRARRHLLPALVAVAIAFALASAPGITSWRAGVLLLPIASALLVPFASSSRVSAGVASALGLAVGGAAWALVTGLPVSRVLALLEVLGAFGLLVAAVSACARARGSSPGVVLLAGGLAAFLLLGTVFYVDPLVLAAQPHRGLQGAIIAASVGGNPLLLLGMHVSGLDLLHTTRLYGASAIADRFYAVPAAWQSSLALAAAALAFAGLSRAVRRPEI